MSGNEVGGVVSTHWYFRDRSGNPPGSLLDSPLRSWYEAGYISDTVCVSNGATQEAPYAKLSAYFPEKNTAFSEGVVPRKPDESELIEAPTIKGTGDTWYFKDRHGAIQGPFRSKQMRQWYVAGYFKASLQVRKGDGPDATFRSLNEQFSDLSKAFTTATAANRKERKAKSNPAVSTAAEEDGSAPPTPPKPAARPSGRASVMKRSETVPEKEAAAKSIAAEAVKAAHHARAASEASPLQPSSNADDSDDSDVETGAEATSADVNKAALEVMPRRELKTDSVENTLKRIGRRRSTLNFRKHRSVELAMGLDDLTELEEDDIVQNIQVLSSTLRDLLKQAETFDDDEHDDEAKQVLKDGAAAEASAREKLTARAADSLRKRNTPQETEDDEQNIDDVAGVGSESAKSPRLSPSLAELQTVQAQMSVLRDENASLRSEVRALRKFIKKNNPDAMGVDGELAVTISRRGTHAPLLPPRPVEEIKKPGPPKMPEVEAVSLARVGSSKLRPHKPRPESLKQETDDEALARSVIVEFGDESPILRHRVACYVENIDNLRVLLKHFVKDACTRGGIAA